jgi:hypothetical protein
MDHAPVLNLLCPICRKHLTAPDATISRVDSVADESDETLRLLKLAAARSPATRQHADATKQTEPEPYDEWAIYD